MDKDWRSVKGDVTLLLPIESDGPDFTSVDIIGTGAEGATTFIAADPSGDIDGLPGTGTKLSSSQPLSRSNAVYLQLPQSWRKVPSRSYQLQHRLWMLMP